MGCHSEWVGSASGSKPSLPEGVEADAPPIPRRPFIPMSPSVPLALRFQCPNAYGNCFLPHHIAGLNQGLPRCSCCAPMLSPARPSSEVPQALPGHAAPKSQHQPSTCLNPLPRVNI